MLSTVQERTPMQDTAAAVHQLLIKGRKVLGSRTAESQSVDMQPEAYRRLLRRSACVLLHTAGYAFGSLLCRVSEGVKCGLFKPLLLLKRRRYDETPSRIHVKEDHRVRRGTILFVGRCVIEGYIRLFSFPVAVCLGLDCCVVYSLQFARRTSNVCVRKRALLTQPRLCRPNTCWQCSWKIDTPSS